VKVRITGEPVMNGEELLAVATQTWRVAIISTILFTIAVVFALRSFRTVMALVASLLVSLVWSNGIAAATVRDLNIISAAFNVLIVGLGGEFGIHFAMRYIELAARGSKRHEALVESAESIGGSLFSSAVTTSLGFFLFLLTDFTGVAQLGLISGVGMFASLASTLTVLPAVLALGEGAAVTAPSMPAWLSNLDRVPRPLRVAHPAVVARARRRGGAAAAAHPLRLQPVSLHDPNQESVARSRSCSAERRVAVDRRPDRAVARRGQTLAEKVKALPEVDSARTLRDYVPADQDEKRDLIATASYFVPAKLTEGPPRHRRRSAVAALARLSEEAGRPRGEALGPARATPARRDRGPARARRREHVRRSRAPARRLAARADPRSAEAHEAGHRQARRPAADARPPDARARRPRPRAGAAEGGHLRRPRARALRRLGPRVVPDAAGLAVYVVEWCRVAWRAMLWALIGGVVCMALFLVFLWRSAWDMLLAFFPLVLAAVLTCAVARLLGQSFNFANVIVLPMLIGMSIDSGVHLVHRHRTNEEEDVLGTSTARAVFYAALTTMLSFGSLAFAPHRGIASIGELLTIGVGLVLVAYVVVLPAVLEWDDRRRRRKRGQLASSRGTVV
jgi:predicted exporter